MVKSIVIRQEKKLVKIVVWQTTSCLAKIEPRFFLLLIM